MFLIPTPYVSLMKYCYSESVFKGWQLLSVLLITFPPSKNFETYLQQFMQKHTSQQEGRVDVMAKYGLRRLSYISKKGPRGKPPTLAEIETASVGLRVFTSSYLCSLLSGCCFQSLYLWGVFGRHHPAPRTKLPTSEGSHYLAFPCRRHPGFRRDKVGRYLPCSRRWRFGFRAQGQDRPRIL